MLRNVINLMTELETKHGIKCVHNEINILSMLLEGGSTPSLEIYSKSRRSLAGHNCDLRRLSSIGLISHVSGPTDKRERRYQLSETGKKILSEHELLIAEALRAAR